MTHPTLAELAYANMVRRVLGLAPITLPPILRRRPLPGGSIAKTLIAQVLS